MQTIKDFEDLLYYLEKFKVKYLIVGGLAFIFHAKPRYTKDMDIWIEPTIQNVEKANRALEKFGSPYSVSLPVKKKEILQLGIAPNRIDIMLDLTDVRFETAWKGKIRSKYGKVTVNWIDIDNLINSKKKIRHPRHQEDIRVLLQVKKMK
ncbi:MAG: hypothetical protein JW827_01740 [Spirochaetes bacterium]|nr:hypothetical protein [Spirochaetota bacterium]